MVRCYVLVQLLVGSLVRLLVGKSYHTKQKDGYSLLTNDPTNNCTHWIWTTKKIGLYKDASSCIQPTNKLLQNLKSGDFHEILYLGEVPTIRIAFSAILL